jgi:hypothetical protein
MTKLIGLLCVAACADAAEPSEGTGNTAIAIHTQAFTGRVDKQPANAAWVGVLDGDDASRGWQTLVGDRGEYKATVTHDRYTVGVVCNELSPAVTLLSRSISDPVDITAVCDALQTGDSHEISARVATGQASELVTVMPLLLARAAVPHVVSSGVTSDFTFEGNAGRYDLVSFGGIDTELGAPLEQVLIARDLDVAADPVVDINPRTATGYVPMGPQITTTTDAPLVLIVDYLTSHGTVVPLANTFEFDIPTVATYASWPADQVIAGDAYRVEIGHRKGLAFESVTTFTRDPSGKTLVPPAPFDPGAKLIGSASIIERLEFAPAADASQYTLVCRTPDHQITYDVSAAWLGTGDRLSYELPVLPLDPAIPADSVSHQECDWEVSATGSTHGIAIGDELARIGVIDGAPAALIGVEHRIAGRSLSQ